MHIQIKTLTGKTYRLEVEPQESILSITQKLSDQESGLPPSQIELIYGGKPLQNYGGTTLKRLDHYQIQDASTLHMVIPSRPLSKVGPAKLPPHASAGKAQDEWRFKGLPDASARKAQKEWKLKAEMGDFDEDLHIVDPPAHFHILNQLERDVVHRSEYYRAGRRYDLSSILAPASVVLEVAEGVGYGELSLMNIVVAIESIAQMEAVRFSTKGISFLRPHEIDHVIEIRRIEVTIINVIQDCMYTVVSEISTNLDEKYLAIKATEIMSLCDDLSTRMGFEQLAENLSLTAALTRIRKMVLLLDAVLVSYVRSHGSGFDLSYFESELDLQGIPVGMDNFGFSFSWVRLACLDAFLDRRKVLVFHLFNEVNHRPGQDLDTGARILTTIQDLTDIWGPVYAVPSTDGLIKYYGLSKGAICPVKVSPGCATAGAVNCHYFSRASFFVRKTSKLLSRHEDPLLAEDDKLLIGGGLHENGYCGYSIKDFKQDWALDTSVLGTHESIWRMESRNLAIGVSKYFGITVSGSQKLVPRTTLKEHILDKWSTNPARSNPGIMNQYLCIEISHCTGYARRIPLKALMTMSSVVAFLDRQSPRWTSTPWGQSLRAALYSNDEDAIFQTWRDFSSDRAQIGELVCCLLELLDSTGRHDHNFDAALLYNDDESVVRIDRRGKDTNDWSMAIEDNHLTCAYAIINEQCLNCEVPNHSASVCHIRHAYTLLETEFAADAFANPGDSSDYTIRPNHRRLTLVDTGNADTAMIGFVTNVASIKRLPLNKPRDLIEICNPVDRWTRSVVFVRASKQSFHGKATPKHTTAQTLSNRPALQNERNPLQGIQPPAQANHCISGDAKASAQEDKFALPRNQLRGSESRRALPTKQSHSQEQIVKTNYPRVPGIKLSTSASTQHSKQQAHRKDSEEGKTLNHNVPMHTARLPRSNADTTDGDDLIPSDIYGQDMWICPQDNYLRLGDLRN